MIEQSDLQKENQKNLDDLIDRLSENQNYHKERDVYVNDIRMLLNIFKNDYQLDNSEIYRKLTLLFEKNDSSDTLLSENLKILKNKMEQVLAANSQYPKLEEIVQGFTKLVDYISLEINRYLFFQSQFSAMRLELKNNVPNESYEIPTEWQVRISQLESENETNKTVLTEAVVTTEIASKTAETATKEAEIAGNKAELAKVKAELASREAKQASATIEDKINKSSLSSITSLSIFSAVILAVSGGITFEAGVFNGIEKATPFRLVFIVALTGFVLISVVFILLYIIAKITGSNIETNCIYWKKSDDNRKCFKKCGDGECIRNFSQRTLICKTVNKYALVFVVDAILILVMYYDFFLWVINTDRGIYNSLRVFLFVAPFIILIAAFFVYKVFYNIQLRYTKVSHINKLLANYFEKREDNQSAFSALESKPDEVICNVFLNEELSEKQKEELSEKQKEELSEKQNFENCINDFLIESTTKNSFTQKEVQRFLKKYVYMHFPLNNRNWPTISRAQHQRNIFARKSYLLQMKGNLVKIQEDKTFKIIVEPNIEDVT